MLFMVFVMCSKVLSCAVKRVSVSNYPAFGRHGDTVRYLSEPCHLWLWSEQQES